ncbi:hypothetical protein K466DRAFT_174712 [Polyporus arcularius HHB13444]|uniref:Uncharacterized protein n=1 Tax=Polyporus arcularius HHB13444 TaxID=1314778 RepID=A0A5C3PA78_9APHY|nr:hypothetical protein K466DRAFT_174712 [Polyporus arcularius HHB13444]
MNGKLNAALRLVNVNVNTLRARTQNLDPSRQPAAHPTAARVSMGASLRISSRCNTYCQCTYAGVLPMLARLVIQNSRNSELRTPELLRNPGMQGSASPTPARVARTHAPRMNRNSWKQVPFARTHACTRACVRSFPESNPIQSNPILILVLVGDVQIQRSFGEAGSTQCSPASDETRPNLARGPGAHRGSASSRDGSPDGMQPGGGGALSTESRSRSGAQGTGRSAGTLILSLPQRGRGGVVDGRTLDRQTER